MYWIGIVILIIAFIFGFSLNGGSANVLLDLRSLFMICIIVFPLLLSSGLFNYFLLGMKIASGRVRKAPENEVKKAVIAIKLSIKLFIISGIIDFVIGGIAMLANLSSLREIGNLAALAVISLLYSLFAAAFLFPVQAKLEAFLTDSTNK